MEAVTEYVLKFKFIGVPAGKYGYGNERHIYDKLTSDELIPRAKEIIANNPDKELVFFRRKADAILDDDWKQLPIPKG